MARRVRRTAFWIVRASDRTGRPHPPAKILHQYPERQAMLDFACVVVAINRSFITPGPSRKAAADREALALKELGR